VDELLKTEFHLEHGLADTTTWVEFIQKSKINNPQSEIKLPPLTDEPGCTETISPDEPFVQILDPATGTATFPVEVIDIIYKYLKDLWKRGTGILPVIPGCGKDARATFRSFNDYWNEYVPKALLPRLHAYELMMAPYAIAHMKIGLKLAETGYHFATEERARIYLTNALEKSDDKQAKLIGFDALAHEAEAVSKIKKSKRFTVIIGNPPYANYSANLSPEARRIVDKYRNFRGVPIRERNQLQFERNIQDDFVKFMSIAQDLVAVSDVGVFSYITNGTMLASTSLRGLRENLAEKFSSLFELNLHGGGNEIIAGAEDDENVFDIVQSVAVHVYVRSKPGGSSEVSYADLLGRRALKYAALASGSVKDTKWRHIQPDAENSGFTPQDEAGGGASRRLDSAFVKFGAGIKTNRDAVVIGFDDASLIETVREFDAKLVSGKHAKSNIHPLLYRPFDVRKIFYHEDVVASRSLPTMKHVVAGPNIGFVCSSTWTTPDRFSVGVSRLMVEMKTGTHDRGTTFFPLYRYETLMGGKAEQVHNLTTEFVKEWRATTNTRFVSTGHGDGEKTTGPEDVLFWLYGLFYSPEYRRRYRAALSQRFPIVLFTSNLALFRELSRLGGELTALHLLESPKLAKPITEFIGKSKVVTKIGWTDDTVWINASGTRGSSVAGTSGFRGVPTAVWNFHIGGYQVCQKWLKDRKGRTLTAEDIARYHKIVISLTETIRLMAEIDQVIDHHGGWPGAFQSADSGEPDPAETTTPPIAAPKKPAPPKAAPAAAWIPNELFGMEGELAPAKKAKAAHKAAKTPTAAKTEPTQRVPADDKNELMAVLRDVLSKNGSCDRETLIQHWAHALGYQRVGEIITETLTNAIRTAKRRGILQEKRGQLHIDRTPVDQWDRTFLKTQFLAVINQNGRIWLERDEAIRQFSRWLGFRRTGRVIKGTVLSLINGLLRDRSIEKDGQEWIRRV
jgi:hypothetical protein